MAFLTFRVKIGNGYSQSKKEQIAQAILSGVVLRTKSGLDVNGKPFPGYSETYAKEKGVGKNAVDLTLTGRMLDEMRVMKIGPSWIDIGYDGRTTIAGRVEGNVLGSYGGNPDPAKARDFLGMGNSELNEILSGFELTAQEIADRMIDDNVDDIVNNLSREQLDRLSEQLAMSKIR